MPLFVQDFLRYMAFELSAGPPFKVAEFDFDKDPLRRARVWLARGGWARPGRDLLRVYSRERQLS
jgi:hypothetical protein